MFATTSAAPMKSVSSAGLRSRSERRIRNSSPPCRATTSVCRIALRNRDPTAFNSSSPAACPKLSLTSLKLSRSMNRTAAPLSVRAARARADVQMLEKRGPVRETGQRVVERGMGELLDRLRLNSFAGGDVRDHAADQDTPVLDRALGPHSVEHPARLAVAADAAGTRPRPTRPGQVSPGLRRTPRDPPDAPPRHTPPRDHPLRGQDRSGPRARRTSDIRSSRRA